MKKVIALLTLFFNFAAFATEGMILVLEAPLLLRPDMTAPISSFVRKGDRIHIHGKNLGLSPNAVIYGNTQVEPVFDVGPSGVEFLQSIDSQGRAVWIERRFVKIIYQDLREFKESISPFEYDPKDYRVHEPIPDKYPFYVTNKRRAYFTYGLGSGHKTSYGYDTSIALEDYSSRHGLNFYYLKKVDYDVSDRFYYGVNVHLYGENNSFFLANSVQSTEFRGQLGVGPSLSFDAYSKEKFQITLTSALTINYDRTFIKQFDSTESEERLFESLSLTPKFGSLFTFKNLLPFASLVVGGEVQFNLESQVKGSKAPVIDRFWNPDQDYIRHPFGGTLAFYIGFVTTN